MARNENKEGDPDDDAINREGRKAPRAHPAHEPGDDEDRDNKRNDKADGEHDPLVRVDRERCNVIGKIDIVLWVKGMQAA